MSSSNEPRRLAEIITNIDRATGYIGDLTVEQLAADSMRRDAVERCVERVAEAMLKIGEERMAQIAPDVPLHAVRGLGNIMRHQYDEVSEHIIYATVMDRFPTLKASCERALGNDASLV